MNDKQASVDKAFDKTKFNLEVVFDKAWGETSRKKEYGLLMAGISTLGFGSVAGAFFPGYLIAQYGSYAIGILTIIMHYLDRSNTNWDKLFKNTGMYVKTEEKDLFPNLVKKKKTEYGYLLQFQYLEGITTDKFIKNQMAIEQMLNSKIDISYHNKFIFVKVYEKPLKSNCPFEKVNIKGALSLTLGYSYKGLETIDISKGEPHCLIAGETGSGKSTLLRGILTNIVLNYNPNDLELHLIDLKEGVELGIFRKCGIVKSFSKNREEAEKSLYKLLAEVKRRYNLFYSKDCVDITEYNKRFKRKALNRKLVVIDEFSLLANEKSSINAMKELAAIARACGVHLLICTQRPSAKVIDGDIKANIPLVVGLKTMNELNSRVIIDEKGLEELKGQGHGIIRACGNKTEFQSMNIPPGQARDLLKPYYIKKDEEVKFIPKVTRVEKKKTGEVIDFDFLNKIRG